MEQKKSSRLDQIFDALSGLTKSKSSSAVIETPVDGRRFLLVGLGNPGREYTRTRHNIGFMLIDAFAKQLGISFTRTQFKSLVTDGHYLGNRVHLAKPQTYMNASGTSVGALIKFYKIPLEILLVIYDDVDLPFSGLRMKPGGGSGGHKGMDSIIKQVGTPDIPRLRLGVGRPPGQRQAAEYVLKPFSAQEDEFLANFIDRAVEATQAYINSGIMDAMTEYNRSEG